LETALNGGSDLSCAYINEDQNFTAYSNTDALVILDPYDTTGTDIETPYAPYTPLYSGGSISICDNTSNNLIGNLSSYVCEIVNAVSDLWKRTTVESTTESNLSTATRNAITNQSGTTSYKNWPTLESALKNTNNPDSGILYFKGSGLSSAVDKNITLGNIEVPCGAWTLIVQNANLTLSGNISYAPTSSCQMNPAQTTHRLSVDP